MKNIKILLTFLFLTFICQFLSAEDVEKITLTDSEKSYTEKQINNFFDVPDWYPDSHPAMPEVVQFGAKPRVFACASCHLTSGSGHPESGSLSGLPAEYFIRQMKAYQRFQRDSTTGVMISIAKGMTDEQIEELSQWVGVGTRVSVR